MFVVNWQHRPSSGTRSTHVTLRSPSLVSQSESDTGHGHTSPHHMTPWSWHELVTPCMLLTNITSPTHQTQRAGAGGSPAVRAQWSAIIIIIITITKIVTQSQRRLAPGGGGSAASAAAAWASPWCWSSGLRWAGSPAGSSAERQSPPGHTSVTYPETLNQWPRITLVIFLLYYSQKVIHLN